MEAMTPIERLNTHPTWNELDDLPENSVVLNDLGDALQKWPDGQWWAPGNGNYGFDSYTIARYPVQILYIPKDEFAE